MNSPVPEPGAATPAQPARHTAFVPRLEESGEPAEEWLLSYADMVTLLLTMFLALLLNARFDKPDPGRIGLHTGESGVSAGAGPGAGGDASGGGGAGAAAGAGGGGAGAGGGVGGGIGAGAGAGIGAGMGGGAGGDAGARTGASLLESLFQLRIETPYDGDTAMGQAVTRRAGSLYAQPESTLAVVKDNDLDRIRAREEALAKVRAGLKSSGLDTFITAAVEGDGIRLNIPNSILFNSGAAELQGRGPSVIKALAPLLIDGKFIVAVEGHTDNNPISTERFPSNWDLSASRAAAVVRVLADAGVGPGRLQAVGYADTRPLTGNDTENGRAENRRVALFLRMP